jgi:hypothetical protein
MPQRPWSHLSIDFVTDLPSSDGFTTILVVVDRFSKSCRLIPLFGLPTALQVAEALFQQVFRHYGPQSTSQVWRAFMEKLRVTVSLTSGYRPQSKGQMERRNQALGRFLRSHFRTGRESGLDSFHGRSTFRTCYITPPLGLPPSSVFWVFSRPWLHGPQARSKLWFRHAEEVWSDAHVRHQRTVHCQKGLADRHHSATPVYHPTTLQSVQGRRLVKGFLSHETIETLTVYVCHSEVELARPKIEVPLNRV